MPYSLHPALLRRAFLAFLLLACALLVYRYGPGYLLRGDGVPVPGDFRVYLTAAERLGAGLSIYVPSDPSPYKYSPTFTYFIRYTFYLLEPRVAASLWMVLSLISFFAAFASFGAKLLARAPRPGLWLAFTLGAMLLSWRGYLEGLSYGQADLFLAAGYLFVASSLLQPGGGWRRALLWAAILVVKPHMGIALLALLFACGWREAGRIGLTTLAAYALPALWLGPSALASLFADWARCLLVQQDAAFLTNNINQALGSVIARVAGAREWAGGLTALFLSLYIFYLAFQAGRAGLRKAWEGAGSEEAKLAWAGFGLAAYLVIAPLSWRWLIADWAPLLAIGLVLKPRGRIFLSWLILAIFSQRLVAGALAGYLAVAQEDPISFYGLYAAANLALFLAFGALPSRKLRDAPSDPGGA